MKKIKQKKQKKTKKTKKQKIKKNKKKQPIFVFNDIQIYKLILHLYYKVNLFSKQRNT